MICLRDVASYINLRLTWHRLVYMNGGGRMMVIEREFGERTYRKGMAYFKEGRVVSLVVGGDKISWGR